MQLTKGTNSLQVLRCLWQVKPLKRRLLLWRPPCRRLIRLSPAHLLQLLLLLPKALLPLPQALPLLALHPLHRVLPPPLLRSCTVHKRSSEKLAGTLIDEQPG